MKYTFRGLRVEECFLQPPEFTAECILEPENDADVAIMNKLLHGCIAHADSNAELPAIKNVYFNPPTTVVLWDDGTKTVVKCQDGDAYSRETGLALCMAKKAMGNNSKFNDIFKKWIPEEKKPVAEVPIKNKIEQKKHCCTCRHYHLDWDDVPCNVCRCGSHWEENK